MRNLNKNNFSVDMIDRSTDHMIIRHTDFAVRLGSEPSHLSVRP